MHEVASVITSSEFTPHPPSAITNPSTWRVAPRGAISPPVRVPEWVSRAISRVDELGHMAPGWDGDDARALGKATCASMRTILASLCAHQGAVPDPGVFAGTDGSLQIEWDTLTRGIEIEVSPEADEPSGYLKVTKTADPATGRPNPALYSYEEGVLDTPHRALELLRWTFQS